MLLFSVEINTLSSKKISQIHRTVFYEFYSVYKYILVVGTANWYSTFCFTAVEMTTSVKNTLEPVIKTIVILGLLMADMSLNIYCW